MAGSPTAESTGRARAAEGIVSDLNRFLAPDGWTLKPHKQLSGRPVYAPARTGTATMAPVDFAHETAARIDAEYISQQVTRMEGAVDTEPELATGTAKEFVESMCKTILDKRQEPYGKNDDLLVLVRKTTKVLRLTPDDIASTEDRPGPVARSTSIAWSHDVDEVFGTHSAGDVPIGRSGPACAAGARSFGSLSGDIEHLLCVDCVE